MADRNASGRAPPSLRAVGATLLLVLCGACKPDVYDIDRMADPIQKARFSCQYLLERALAREDQKDADGVLRRRVADFAEPTLTTTDDVVQVAWRAGAITLRENGSSHHGRCAVHLRPQGRWIEAVSLDGRDLHARFGM